MTSIRTFRMSLRAHLARASAGEVITVTQHGRPIVEVVPVGTASAARRNRTALDVPVMSPPPQPEVPDPASTGTSGQDGGGP